MKELKENATIHYVLTLATFGSLKKVTVIQQLFNFLKWERNTAWSDYGSLFTVKAKTIKSLDINHEKNVLSSQ